MTNIGTGANHNSSIVYAELLKFVSRSGGAAVLPVDLRAWAKFNPNLDSTRFMAMMQVINNLQSSQLFLAVPPTHFI